MKEKNRLRFWVNLQTLSVNIPPATYKLLSHSTLTFRLLFSWHFPQAHPLCFEIVLRKPLLFNEQAHYFVLEALHCQVLPFCRGQAGFHGKQPFKAPICCPPPLCQNKCFSPPGTAFQPTGPETGNQEPTI